MRKVKLFRIIMALILSAVLLAGPVADLPAFAAEVAEETSFESSDVVEETMSEEIIDTEEESEAESEAASSESAEQEVSEGALEDISSEDLSEEVSEEDLADAEPSEDVTEELSMPDNYCLSQEQIEQKQILADCVKDIAQADEDSYRSREVIFLADTNEEAESIAEGYQAELVSFSYGVGVLLLSKERSVVETVTMAADSQNNLPVVWPNYIRTSFSEPVTEASFHDPFLDWKADAYQWHHTAIGSNYAWDEEHTGEGINVAVVDTGVTSVTVNGEKELEVAGTKNNEFLPQNANTEVNKHATHVAGIIAARSNSTYGCGVAPDAAIYDYRVLDKGGSGSDSGIIAALNCIATDDNNIQIVNMSLGGPNYNGLVQEAINNLYNKGIVVFAAAGNDNTSCHVYPASNEHVISVAATGKANERASFSNFGSSVDLSAPGEQIYSTVPEYTVKDAQGNDKRISYECINGTSMASPMAAGEAAVILSANLSVLSGKTGGEKVDTLEQLMKASAVAAGKNMGSGIVSLPKALGISTFSQQVAVPTISSAYFFNEDESLDKSIAKITINSLIGTKVYYTTDGTTPKVNCLNYTVPFEVKNKTSYTIKAIAVNELGVESKVATYKVKLYPVVTSIDVFGRTTLMAGQTTQLKATAVPACATKKSVTWKVKDSDSKIIVTKSGKVTVPKSTPEGTYVLCATAETYTREVVITVNNTALIKSATAEKTIYVTMNSRSQEVNLLNYVKVKPVVAEDIVLASDFIWTSSNSKVISLGTPAGTGRILKPGTTVITAVASDASGITVSYKLVVKEGVINVTLSDKNDILPQGRKLSLTAFINDRKANNRVEWSIEPENEGVTIKNGVLTASKDAKCQNYSIKAKAKDSDKYCTQKVTVSEERITKISIKKKNVSMFRKITGVTQDEKLLVPIEVKASTGAPSILSLAMDNSNSEVVTAYLLYKVDGTFYIELIGKKRGTATITIRSKDGTNLSQTCKVTVTNPVSEVKIAPVAGRNSVVAKGKKLQMRASVLQENGLTSKTKVKWSIPDAIKGVSISSTGMVSVGKSVPEDSLFTVRAEATDGSGVFSTYVIMVVSPVSKIKVSGFDDLDNICRNKDGSYTLTCTTQNEGCVFIPLDISLSDGNTYNCRTTRFTVESSNEAVAYAYYTPIRPGTYNKQYVVVYMHEEGDTSVTVTAQDGTKKSMKVKLHIKFAPGYNPGE